jgi:hypothetical protein
LVTTKDPAGGLSQPRTTRIATARRPPETLTHFHVRRQAGKQCYSRSTRKQTGPNSVEYLDEFLNNGR